MDRRTASSRGRRRRADRPSASPTASTAAIAGRTAMSIAASRAAMRCRARCAGRRPTRFVVTLRDDYGDQKPMRYFGTPLIDGQARRPQSATATTTSPTAIIHYRDNRTSLPADWPPSETITVSNPAYRLTSKRSWLNLESYCWVAGGRLLPQRQRRRRLRPAGSTAPTRPASSTTRRNGAIRAA